MSDFLIKELQGIAPYVPGEQPQDQQYIKLNTNESPYPPAPGVIAAVNAGEGALLRLYPDPDCAKLLNAAAKYHGLLPEQILAGNGSDENLFFAIRAFCNSETPLVFADITYGCYKVWSSFLGIPQKIIPLREDFTIAPEDYFDAGGTVVLANPNAPTGIALSAAQVEEIIKHNTQNIVIIDEAYVDFGAESVVHLIDKYDNLIVTQTFSKSRQMAGARLGFTFGAAELIADMNRVKFSINPYNINRVTTAAGIASLADRAYFENTSGMIRRTREWTVSELTKLGFETLPSSSNFIFARTDKIGGGSLYAALKENGILVRHFDLPRISDWVRITVGTQEDMRALIEMIGEINGDIKRENTDQ